MSTPNYATSIAPKPYIAAGETSPVEHWFSESVRALPGGVTPPTYPDTLNSYERAEVDRYVLDRSDATLASLRLPAAIAKAKEYKTLFANPKFKAWEASTKLDRIAQWKASVGASFADNLGSIPASLDDTGGGGTPPATAVIPPTVGTCARPVAGIASGARGGAITVVLNCSTPSSTIHYSKNGGAWTTYASAVSMVNSDILDFYGSATGLTDSDSDSFENV